MPVEIPCTGNHSCTIGALAFRETNDVDTEQVTNISEELALACAGTLTTRTDANTGTITLTTGHTILTGDVVDVYWLDSDGLLQVQSDVTVGTVSVNSVPIDSGVGTDLPVATTAVRIALIHTATIPSIDGDNCTAIAYGLNKPGYIRMRNTAPATILPALFREAVGNARIWFSASGLTVPTSTVLASCKASTYATSGSPRVTLGFSQTN